ncbi:hypothetical protein PFISCL1PPCAC_2979 [Pristionchus fissidentatus]|uniref:Uncharacterized protein n=1 Tax=Pristionchus fissidentatus TaxID=1538716 RepID=A0AAV5V016_9BILA|nr:hypothetical protein PFISCL1PPCAC_2979 [Pristionchus fissidentatus]
MRILAGFFSLVFLFVNPTMFVKVFGEISKLVHLSDDSSFKPYLFRWMENVTREGDLRKTCDIAQFALVSTLCLLHIILSILHAYGCFTGRPAYIRPMVVTCFASTGLLLIYLMVAIFVVFNVTFPLGQLKDAMNFETTHKSNLTIGGVFFVIYILWDAITLYTYFDIKQLHEDFMYWIVEERNSQRKGSLRLSTDRSGGSSKSSKASKNSTKSFKMEEHSRPGSAAASIPSKKTSLANNRLSVPL